ncbi:MAG: cold shock domain-containing protein [Deltaproteobacteria bacterium]|nr:cold shock domain-containing protein [Deltaproteobacteria bacterium]
MDDNKVHRGYVKSWNSHKVFGMIQGDDGNMVFLHISEIVSGAKHPRTGQMVEYQIKQETDPSKRYRATDVVVLYKFKGE